MSEVWLTIEQAARELGIAERTCRRWLTQANSRKSRDAREAGRSGAFPPRHARVWPRNWRTHRRRKCPGPDGCPAHARPQAPDAILTETLLDEMHAIRTDTAEYKQTIQQQAQAISRLTRGVSAVEATIQQSLPVSSVKQGARRPGWFSRAMADQARPQNRPPGDPAHPAPSPEQIGGVRRRRQSPCGAPLANCTTAAASPSPARCNCSAWCSAASWSPTPILLLHWHFYPPY